MRLEFSCPKTEEHFALDHDMDWRELEKFRDREVKVTCPRCHQVHAVAFTKCFEPH